VNQETKDIVVTREFGVPVELVWKAWSEAEGVKQWWGPDCFTCPSAEMDFREGGTSVVCMRAPKEFGGQDMYSAWLYKKINRMQSIEFVQNLADKDGQVMEPVKLGMPPEFPMYLRTVVTFKDIGNGNTEMTVTEYAFLVCPMLAMAEKGLEQCINKMQRSFQKC
jgi:uncharacterized protein YndB with AHSA1/START domain